MQTVERATIHYQKDALPPIEKGRFTRNGSRAILWEWNPAKHKFDQRDIVTNVAVQEREGKLIVQGHSKLLGEDTGFSGDETLVTVTVTPTAGCKDC